MNYFQVRHGQGVHNVQGQNGPEALVSREFFDAQLSPLGWQQVITITDNLSLIIFYCIAQILLQHCCFGVPQCYRMVCN